MHSNKELKMYRKGLGKEGKKSWLAFEDRMRAHDWPQCLSWVCTVKQVFIGHAQQEAHCRLLREQSKWRDAVRVGMPRFVWSTGQSTGN